MRVLRSNTHRSHNRWVLRELIAMKLHSFEMKGNRLFHVLNGLVDGLARRDTSVKADDIGAIISARILNHDRVFGHREPLSKPACLTMLLSVPFGTSSAKCPGTVTQPSFDAWWNCRWLPRCLLRNQPSASNSRIKSRTFTLTHRSHGFRWIKKYSSLIDEHVSALKGKV
jgi:hypothetical protein